MQSSPAPLDGHLRNAALILQKRIDEENKPYVVSGHHLKWKWHLIDGFPQRGDLKSVKMRNWEKRIWKQKTVTIIANKRSLEVWIDSKGYKNPNTLVSKASLRAFREAAKFAKWQGLVIKLAKSKHQDDLQSGHFQLHTKAYNDMLKPLAAMPGNERAGLKYDGSPPGFGRWPELTGEESSEATYGADWFLLVFPKWIIEKLGRMEQEMKEIIERLPTKKEKREPL